MTVKELRERLAELDDKTDIVVYWEEGTEHQYFGIDNVSLARGTPRRHADGKPGFTFVSLSPE